MIAPSGATSLQRGDQNEEEVSRNDAKAQRKTLFVVPLRDAFFSFDLAQPTIHAGMMGFQHLCITMNAWESA